MALKPTIYKFRIALTDINRDYYDSLALTVARHPSETTSRMISRVIAFCLNAHPQLSFTKGLSTVEEPDLWHKNIDGHIANWIEIGEPDPERIKKACRIADKVTIYSFNTKSDIWWTQNQTKLEVLNASVYRFEPEAINQLAALCARTMEMSVMLTGNSVYVSTDRGDCEIVTETLKGTDNE